MKLHQPMLFSTVGSEEREAWKLGNINDEK